MKGIGNLNGMNAVCGIYFALKNWSGQRQLKALAKENL